MPTATATRPGNPRFKARAIRAFSLLVPAEEIYSFVRAVPNLAEVIRPRVVIDGAGSEFTIRSAPGDQEEISFTLSIVTELKNKEIVWRAQSGKKVVAGGKFELSPAPRDEGTEMKVTLEYNPSAGDLGAWFGRHLPSGVPEQLKENLRRLKQLLEAGEIPTIDGQPTGAKRRAA